MKFYKETNFQETLIGKIPKDWKVMRATDVAEYINGYPFSPEDWKTSGIPIIRIQNLNDPNAEFNFFDGEIDEIYKVKNGDLLFSWSASIGVYIWERGDAVLNQHIFKVIPKPKVNKLFLYYALFLAIEQLKRRVHGSTMKHFRRGELETTFLPFPPLGEQQKITEILSTVDEAIQKTDEIIAKTERLKKALMNELLTGRVRVKEENGKLIFHRETEFQETDLGRIPKNWKIVKLEDACIKITDGSHWSPKQVEKSNYRIATVANLKELYIDIDSCKFISEEDYLRLAAEGDVPEEGDVLFSKDGTVGICFTFKQSNYKVGLLSSIAIIRPNRHILFSDFLAYALKSPNVFWEVTGRKTGTALTRITLNNLKKVNIPIPPLSEQVKIAEILLTVDRTIELYYKERNILEKLKRSLMDMLLTGKVRVRED
jgi:type I restriction enzyme S subunit